MKPQSKIICIGFSPLQKELNKFAPQNYIFCFEAQCFKTQEIIDNENPALIILFSENDYFLKMGINFSKIFYSQIPTIYITQDNSLYHKLQILKLGVDAYINQPICVQELLVRVDSLIAKRNYPERRINKKHALFLEQVNRHIEKNIDKQIFDTTSLAFDLNLCRSQLYKKLKRFTGKSTSAYVRDYKLKKAKALIEDNFGSVSQVAMEVGFNSFSYFSIQFRKQFGITPSSLQKH